MGLVLTCLCLFSVTAIAGDRPIVTEIDVSRYSGQNYAIVPAENVAPGMYAGDHAPSVALEIIRPNLSACKVGRVYTDSPVLRVAPSQRIFADGERAIFLARNVKFTYGQRVRFYVEIVSPVCLTLCYDVFVSSNYCVRQACEPAYLVHGAIQPCQ